MKVNILVCVKQVPKEENLKLDPVTKTLIRSQGTGVISEYDKYAMELAARLKAEDGGKVTAVTMGPPSSMEVLRYCIAVGADDVYLLSDRALGGADAYATVNALAAAKAYLEAGGTKYDLVLCGKQASDSDTSLVMPELAECLGHAAGHFRERLRAFRGEAHSSARNRMRVRTTSSCRCRQLRLWTRPCSRRAARICA